MQPVTINEIAQFLQTVLSAFSDSIFMAVTLMMAFTVAYGIKRLMVDP